MKIKRKQVFEKYDGHCAYCGKEITMKEMQIDHFTPQVYEGTDDIENLMPTCRDCNNYKYCHSIEQFRGYIEDIYDQLATTAKWRVAERFGIFERRKVRITFFFEKYENIK
jgi:5-methylcytosine-specific restriction endonuclease McrA